VGIAKRATDRLSTKLQQYRGTRKPVSIEEEFRLLTLQVGAAGGRRVPGRLGRLQAAAAPAGVALPGPLGRLQAAPAGGGPSGCSLDRVPGAHGQLGSLG
jgi:hypothetical protein